MIKRILIFSSICFYFSLCFVYDFAISFSPEINRTFADPNLSLETKIKFALAFALTKYDGKKIWLIYSVNSSCKLKETRKEISSFYDEIVSLEQLIDNQMILKKNNIFKSKTEVLDGKKTNYHNLIGEVKQLEINKNSVITNKLAIILDYSLESGRPCLYQICIQQMKQPFFKEPRAIFWLGEEISPVSIDWLINQFYQSKYENLKFQIITAIGAHGCMDKMIDFEKNIVLGQYPITLKNEAIYWLGHQDSIKNIKFLTTIAIKAKDNRLRKNAIFALSQIKDENAQTIISILAKQDRDIQVRQEAIFWLGQIGNEAALDMLKEILMNEKNTQLKAYIISAIGQSLEPKAKPLLWQVAQTDPDAKIRKKAIFWLERMREQRMRHFWNDLIDENNQPGAN